LFTYYQTSEYNEHATEHMALSVCGKYMYVHCVSKKFTTKTFSDSELS